MKKVILALMAAAMLATTAIEAFAGPGAPPAAHHASEHGFLLDARLAGMKAALKLNGEQEKLWPTFEAAVREGARDRVEAMRDLHEDLSGPEGPSPVALMSEMSEALEKDADALKKVANAAKPLYESLDERQKAHFGPLLHMLRESGPHPGLWRGERGPKPL